MSQFGGATGNVPEHEIVVLVVDDRGNASVRVELGVLGTLVLGLAEVEVDGVVGQPELLEHGGDLPKNRTCASVSWTRRQNVAVATYQPLGPAEWV